VFRVVLASFVLVTSTLLVSDTVCTYTQKITIVLLLRGEWWLLLNCTDIHTVCNEDLGDKPSNHRRCG